MPEIQKLSKSELKLADIIWADGPVTSAELIKAAEKLLGWKRTTTYTILKRVCNKGVIQNNNSIVSAIMMREEYFAGQSRSFVEDTFGGSLPLFLASFIGNKKLSQSQAEELRQIIEGHDGGVSNG
ncbi:MAG: BlaI/MecI/CopY family transcriptional regulator [Clostridiales bacterium]|jgi:predicted transcriptional regulator|nr:BlaI/MecI/CopY family transcriptional regulator [Clostridiales bacterium]